MRIAVLTAIFAGCAFAQTQSAPDARQIDVQEIMARVAQSQAASLEARKTFVYDQEVLLRMKRPGGKLAREERVTYTVLPSDSGVSRKLTDCEGKYELHGRFISYTQAGYHYKGLDIDGDLMGSFEDSTGEAKALDGISYDYFPLTAERQATYIFTLEGTETVKGRMAYRVRFVPRDKTSIFDDDDGDSAAWKGVALIDAAEYQPVSVVTELAARVPLAVKLLLGTDIRGLGFSISYQRVADGIWFPVSFGGEFEVRGLFLYRRTITVSLVNKNFRRADVSSTVAYSPIQ